MSDGPSHASSFDENDYARPNQPWQCGWAAAGHACPLGPTKWGLCRSAYECSPYKKADTWLCARTKARGGTCDEGPLPDGTCCKQIQKCQPTRSVLSKRGVCSLTVFTAAIALAMIILGVPNRQLLVSPGELTSQHSQVVDRCEDCHAAVAGGAEKWIHNAVSTQAAQQQSDLCLRCHVELGAQAKHPHGQTPELLAELTRQRLDDPRSPLNLANSELVVAKSIWRPPGSDHAGLACATCHREHRGKQAHLAELTNQQCQVCHVDAFRSFSSGHPEFAEYPYERRTRLYFDHLSHFGEHFATTSASGDRKCSDCHQPDSAGRYMLVNEFETTCAECHSQQIQDDTTLGLPAISIPGLDVDALVKNGRTVGQWPSDYPLHVEAAGTVSPLQRLLLRSYDEYGEIEQALSEVDLRDLREVDSAQLQAAESLVWLLKESLYDIIEMGHPELFRRLNAVLGPEVNEEQIAMLANSYPLHMTITMQERWLPNLRAEVQARRSGTSLPVPEEIAVTDPVIAIQQERLADKLLASGWYLHGSSLSLRYRAIGHEDPFLKVLLDIGASGVVSRRDTSPTHATLRDLFKQVASPFSAGRCTKCHSVESNPITGTHVNWRPYRRPLSEHRFTGFSHTPHVTLLREEACSKCHPFSEQQRDANSVFRPEFISSEWQPAMDAHRFTSDFEAISKANCAKCHSHDSGRDTCLTCHNYHVR